MQVMVQEAPFDAGELLNIFSARQTNAGAIVSFTGVVRDVDSTLDHMMIEHYPGMTEKALRGIVDTAVARWHLADALVLHRFGALRPQDPIMMVLTAARHRADAFAAADFLMDYLKSRAPFWKKEMTGAGAGWVAAKDTDEDALSRWDTSLRDNDTA